MRGPGGQSWGMVGGWHWGQPLRGHLLPQVHLTGLPSRSRKLSFSPQANIPPTHTQIHAISHPTSRALGGQGDPATMGLPLTACVTLGGWLTFSLHLNAPIWRMGAVIPPTSAGLLKESHQFFHIWCLDHGQHSVH